MHRQTARQFKMAQKTYVRHDTPSTSSTRGPSLAPNDHAGHDVNQSMVPTLSVVSRAAEQPRHDGIGYDFEILPARKGKRAK